MSNNTDNSAETKVINTRNRDPKINEVYKSLEKENIEGIQREMNERYNFTNNINEIMLSAQKAVQSKCSTHLLNVERNGNINEEVLKSGKVPTAKPGKEKEFENSMKALNECQQPIFDKVSSFRSVTELMNGFSIRSSEFCLDDCEEELNNNRSNPNYDITNCMKDCFRNVRYNSFTLGKFVDMEKNSIVNSLFEGTSKI